MSYDGRPRKGWLVQHSSRGSSPDSVVEQGVVIETGRRTSSGTFNLTVLTKDGIQTWKIGDGRLAWGESERWMDRRGHRLVPKTSWFLRVLESN